MGMLNNGQRKILYVVTEDWYFCTHRLALARTVRDAGYNVTVATRIDADSEKILSANLNIINLPFDRSLQSPWRDLKLLRQLIALYRHCQPDLVHQIALKPIVLGSIAARWCGFHHIVNSFTGLGYVFTGHNLPQSLLRILLIPILRFLIRHKHSWVIVQNQDDMRYLIKNGILDPNRTRLIRGSGVDINEFYPVNEPDAPVIVICPSRMLGDKGIREFVEAARRLYQHNVDARFILVGPLDQANPSAISDQEMSVWTKEGLIEWWGKCSDMAEVYQQSHIVCLPSYREGLPKVLLEGAACGRPLVASNVPGCREIVRHGDNGLLVPSRDPIRLAEALLMLIENKPLRERMGRRSREIAVREFSLDKVNRETLAFYSDVLTSV